MKLKSFEDLDEYFDFNQKIKICDKLQPLAIKNGMNLFGIELLKN